MKELVSLCMLSLSMGITLTQIYRLNTTCERVTSQQSQFTPHCFNHSHVINSSPQTVHVLGQRDKWPPILNTVMGPDQMSKHYQGNTQKGSSGCLCGKGPTVHGTQKSFTWNQKGVLKGFYGDSGRTLLGCR
jgi:hypothetical protein